ncbi:hypothetical protein [Massilia sp. NR 4-1]|uniref:hypothetical protein n=1 Tax=Massilia sp. NR 4-1 TaxID=1678028 RepID=UPI0012371DA4|nr:hypothetical protein [Massilia sp. NR 4-1]
MTGNPFVVVEDQCRAKLCLSLTKKDQHAITNENHSHLIEIKVFKINGNNLAIRSSADMTQA